MSKSAIEWTDETWNPVTGCTKVSAGCKHCYAEREWPRMTRLVPAYAGREFTDVRMHLDRIEQPLHWKKPRRIFVNSMSDLFHEAVDQRFISDVFGIMAACPQHTFQILTKRPARALELLGQGCMGRFQDDVEECFAMHSDDPLIWPLHNVLIGVSVENQETADERIPLLLQIPSNWRWISAEPLLGPLSIENYVDLFLPDLLVWVVVGGESGPNARPMHPDWVRSLRDQCAAANTPFLFKQWGEYCGDRDFRAPAHKWEMIDRSGRTLQDAGSTANMGPITHVARVGKKRAGRLLDGVLHDEYPFAFVIGGAACPA